MMPLSGNDALRQALMNEGFASSKRELDSLVSWCGRILDVDQVLQTKADFYEPGLHAIHRVASDLLTLAQTDPQKWAREVAECTRLAIRGSEVRQTLAVASQKAVASVTGSLYSSLSYLAFGAIACTVVYAFFRTTRSDEGVLPLAKRVIRRIGKLRRSGPPVAQEVATPLTKFVMKEEQAPVPPDEKSQEQARLEEEWRKRREMVINGKI